jgi:tetratricopeptide (TPR) repeat protein
MEASLALLKCIAKASLPALGSGVEGDFAREVLPRIAQDVWNQWGQDRSEADCRTVIRELAGLAPAEGRAAVSQAIDEAARDQPAEVRARVATFVRMIPRALHQALVRREDPRGLTVPAQLPLSRAEDLQDLLPQRLPRFKTGDRPLAEVDRELVKLLGIAAFGEMWLAHNPRLSSMPPVALAFCLDGVARDRLLKHETATLIRIMSQGEYPGIVPLRYLHLSADPPCLEYEFIEGGNLPFVVYGHQAAKGPLAANAASKIVLQIARAIGQVHLLPSPIVHRDLKPSNVLVRKQDDKVEFLIANFGLGEVKASLALEQTRQDSPSQQRLTALNGAHTPLYASPEQKRGEEPDPRDDVHALGVLWYQLLIGDFTEGAPAGGAWRKNLAQQGVPAKLLDLLESCFEAKAVHRPPNAAAVTAQLEPILAEERQRYHREKEAEEQRELARVQEEGETRLTALVRAALDRNRGELTELDTQAIEELRQQYRLAPARVDAVIIPLREQWLKAHPPSHPDLGIEISPDYLALAIHALKQGDHPAVIAACNQALEADPPPLRAYRLRARAYAARQRFDKALADFNTLIDTPGATSGDFVERGRLFAQQGQMDKAIQDFTQALARDQHLFAAYVGRAQAYLASGSWGLAFADFDAALQLDPEAVEVLADRGEAHLARKSYDLALADFTEAARLEPGQARCFVGQGRVHLALGQVEEALADLNRATQADPTCGRVYLERGIVHAQLGEDEQAVQDFTDALRFDKQLAQVYAHRARAYARLGQYSRAESDFKRAIQADPGEAILYVERGDVRAARGSLSSALEDYTRALKVDKNLARAHFQRGVAYLRSGWYGSATSSFTRSLELAPEEHQAYALRALAYAHKGQHEQALMDAEECFRRRSHLAIAHNVRGLVLAGREAPEQALLDLSEAIRRDPKSAEFRADRGLVHHARGDYDQAIADFKEAIKLDPKEASHYLHRARAYEKRGDKGKAQLDRARAARLLGERVKEQKQPSEETQSDAEQKQPDEETQSDVAITPGPEAATATPSPPGT